MKRLDISEFSAFKDALIADRETFEVFSTTYSRKIKLNKTSIFFSEGTTSTSVMKLIQMVREDADKYLANSRDVHGNFDDFIFDKDIQSYDIQYSSFIDKPKHKSNTLVTGWKIDLTAAYWKAALNMGILTPETDEFLYGIDFGYDKFGHKLDDKKLRKDVRLKAFGSLATRKIHDKYIDGVLQNEFIPVIVNKLHRAIYLNVNEKIAEIMNTIVLEFFDNMIFYYWDCVFVDDEVDKQSIIDRIGELGFECKLEGDKTEFELNLEESEPYLKDLTTKKVYHIDEGEIIY